jgi:hypothetical protein
VGCLAALLLRRQPPRARPRAYRSQAEPGAGRRRRHWLLYWLLVCWSSQPDSECAVSVAHSPERHTYYNLPYTQEERWEGKGMGWNGMERWEPRRATGRASLDLKKRKRGRPLPPMHAYLRHMHKKKADTPRRTAARASPAWLLYLGQLLRRIGARLARPTDVGRPAC